MSAPIALTPPRKHYRQVVDHFDCPECGEPLMPLRPSINHVIYSDRTEYGTEYPKVQRIVRTFYPCMCEVEHVPES